jgi:hypothetical protein
MCYTIHICMVVGALAQLAARWGCPSKAGFLKVQLGKACSFQHRAGGLREGGCSLIALLWRPIVQLSCEMRGVTD